MIKKLLFTLIALSVFQYGKAQFVNIPDTAFISWLKNNGYTACLSGNLLDTSCPDVLNTTRLRISNAPIVKLIGIEGFTNLTHLECDSLAIDTLPPLPTTIISLSCRYCQQLVHVDSLPAGLDTLTLSVDSALTTLPLLPGAMRYLDCSQNLLSALPELPSQLTYLNCSFNFIPGLDSLLPSSLRWLNCANNQIGELDGDLPNELTYLNCAHNQISNLVSWPDSLRELRSDENPLTTMPPLPRWLSYLSCSRNLLSVLPSLPSTLTYLYCNNNSLAALPAFPKGLLVINCSRNKVKKMPALPDSLQYLYCSSNQLPDIPKLPAKLQLLICSNNHLIDLPLLPQSLTWLECSRNKMTYFPELPDSMNTLKVNDNPTLVCFPKLTRITYFEFKNSSVTCFLSYGYVSKSNPQLDTFPICDTTNNRFKCGLAESAVTYNQFGAIYIYPNPASDEINLGGEWTANGIAEIRNTLGQLMHRCTVIAGRAKLNISQLPAGIYTLTLQTRESRTTQRLIIE